jgi:hypothetical protein
MIKSKTHTTVKGKDNARRIRMQLSLAAEAYVTVGIHDDAVYPDGTSVAQVALFNEFGTDTIPERSFVRSAIYEAHESINAWRAEALKNIAEKGWTAEKGLTMLGFRIQELIRNKIKSNVPPPNSARTQARKRRLGVPQRTLIETMHMLNSVTFRVVLGKGSAGH